MTNAEIIDAVKRLQGALSRAQDTMRQPTKYIAEAQVTADKAVEALSQRTWVGLTEEERHSAVWTDGEFGDGVLWAEKLLKERNT